MTVVDDNVMLALARVGYGFECDVYVLVQVIDLPVRCFNDILQETNLLFLDQIEMLPASATCANHFGLPILIQLLEEAQETWWTVTM